MTYSQAKALILHYWHMSGVLGGLDENMMIRELVRKQARIQELEAENERLRALLQEAARSALTSPGKTHSAAWILRKMNEVQHEVQP